MEQRFGEDCNRKFFALTLVYDRQMIQNLKNEISRLEDKV